MRALRVFRELQQNGVEFRAQEPTGRDITGFTYRVYIQGLHTGFRYRVYIQGLDTGFIYRVWIQDLDTGFIYRVNI